jgi:DNA/RNA endonuclease YhcR with UshA esterase domain
MTLVLALTLIVGAQTSPVRGARNYDPQTETTIKGTIEAVNQVHGRQGCCGEHLSLNTGTALVQVHVGPAAYVKQQQFSFVKGDEIEVTGSKIELNGKDVIIAREIRKQGKTLVLRSPQGIPNWAGSRGWYN